MKTLVLEELDGGHTHVVEVGRLLVAGFTGRDPDAVQEHVDELAALGVPTPQETPTLYRLDPGLVSQTEALVVHGANTSGEVEPVVVVSNGQLLLAVGSDHTDRDVEREDIAASKAASGKVIGSTCIRIDEIDDWDGAQLESRIDDGIDYQSGTIAGLLPLETLLDVLEVSHDLILADGDVLFLGTVPVAGDIRPADAFAASLTVPDHGRLSLTYRVVATTSTGRGPMRKPELEFTPTEAVPWTQVSGGVEGQTERLLSTDPETGLATRMLRFAPGVDTTDLGVLRHDFWEEVYILEGELHDLTLDQRFGPGTYASRPPGMPHGPWRSEPGCVTFEVRYPAS